VRIFVYIIKSDAKSSNSAYYEHKPFIYQVGLTRDPAERLAELQLNCPVELTLLHFFEILAEDPYAVEAEIYNRLTAYRLHGNWFALHKAQVDWFLRLTTVNYRSQLGREAIFKVKSVL